MMSVCIASGPLAMLARAMTSRRQVARQALGTIKRANANNWRSQVRTNISWLKITSDVQCLSGVIRLTLGFALTAYCWSSTRCAIDHVYQGIGTWSDIAAAAAGIAGTALAFACAHAIHAATATMLNHTTARRNSLDGRKFFADATPFWLYYFGVSKALQYPRPAAVLGGREARFGVGSPEARNVFCTLGTVNCVCLGADWTAGGLPTLEKSLTTPSRSARDGLAVDAIGIKESDAAYLSGLGVWAGSTMPLRLLAGMTSGATRVGAPTTVPIDMVSPLEASTLALDINQKLVAAGVITCIYVSDDFGDDLERSLKREGWTRQGEKGLRLCQDPTQSTLGIVDLVMVTLPPRPSESDGASIVQSIATPMSFTDRPMVHIDAWTLDSRSVAAGLGVTQAAVVLELPETGASDNKLGVWLYSRDGWPNH